MISAYIDRFEGSAAVLLLGDDMKKVNFPRSYLPKNVGEGDYITITIDYDEETTREAEREALALMKD